jgi:hypothetical protein
LLSVLFLSEHGVAPEVEGHSLKKPTEAGDSIASPLEDFDLIIEAFHESAGMSVNEVIGNFLHIRFQGF